MHTRSFFISLFILLSFTFSAFSQRVSIGDNILNLGFGPSTQYKSYMNASPALRLSADHGYQKIGPGLLTLGASLGMVSSTNIDNSGIFKITTHYSVIALQARGAWYMSMEEYGVHALNVYGGLGTGLRVESYSVKVTGNTVANDSGTRFPLQFSFFFGGNYTLTKKLAAFAEFGYDVSYGTVGVSFRL